MRASTARSARPPLTSLRVMVACGSEVLRRGVEALLGDLDGVAEVLSAPDEPSIARLLKRRPVDLVIFICCRSDSTTENTLTSIRTAGVRCLVVLNTFDESFLRQAARYPADGFIMTEELTGSSLRSALQRLSRDEMPFPAALGRVALSALREDALPAPSPVLSPREYETLTLLAQGLSNKEIADELRITEHGAKRHVGNILSKLNCSNRTMAARTAYRMGILADADS